MKRVPRTVVDGETGERVKKDVPVRFRRWWWTDASNGKLYLQLRYGNKALELQKGKPTIEIEGTDKLMSVMSEIGKAVADGELDAILLSAKKERGSRFKRRSK